MKISKDCNGKQKLTKELFFENTKNNSNLRKVEVVRARLLFRNLHINSELDRVKKLKCKERLTPCYTEFSFCNES